VLIPSNDNSLLLKSIASAEQVLPVRKFAKSEKKVFQQSLRIEKLLNEVDLEDSYDPLDYEVGFHTAVWNLLHNNRQNVNQEQDQKSQISNRFVACVCICKLITR